MHLRLITYSVTVFHQIATRFGKWARPIFVFSKEDHLRAQRAPSAIALGKNWLFHWVKNERSVPAVCSPLKTNPGPPTPEA